MSPPRASLPPPRPEPTLRRRLAAAAVLAAALTASLGLLHWLGWGWWLFSGVVVIFGAAAWLVPWIGVRWLDDLLHLLRRWRWAREEGQHHSFAGIPLRVRDDGHAPWIAGHDVRRAVPLRDDEAALVARFHGEWLRDEAGVLWLRAAAVVAFLERCPTRREPRTVRLRRYVEREILYPAAERLRRAAR